MKQENLFGTENEKKDSGPVECLGMTFESDEARRTHFTDLLRDKLKDPEFRSIEGFPIGTDEAILELSDPPYYTVCPNPWLNDFVELWESQKTSSDVTYHREPLAVDVSVGKTDALYKAHGYHTKVPHLAIVPSILHYTSPGDIVLDAFCGSGMTGVAAQYCGFAPETYKTELEKKCSDEEKQQPEWGTRKVILNDLSPVASYISANYNIPFDVETFLIAGEKILEEVESELGWMYKTIHSDGVTLAKIEYTAWSEVFHCPDCNCEIDFLNEALNRETNRVRDTFPCPNCSSELNKKKLDKCYESKWDPILSKSIQVAKRTPSIICYKVNGKKFEKKPDDKDLQLLKDIEELDFPDLFPTERMMHANSDVECWGDKWRAGTASFSHVHHLYLPRAAHSLSLLWRKVKEVDDHRLRQALTYFVEQSIWGMSLLNRYTPSHFSHVNQQLTGVYYIASQHAECSPSYNLSGKLKRLAKAFAGVDMTKGNAAVNVCNSSSLGLADSSIDYVFTDPPFGDNLVYSELNFLIESFHNVFTNQNSEAIMSKHQAKGLIEYQSLMRDCFIEYRRVLKPGRWITIVFSNTKASVWNGIQTAVQEAGLIVANVSALDKKQGSFNSVSNATSVKQDLIITAYKPSEDIQEKFSSKDDIVDCVWSFISSHLAQLPTVQFDGSTISYIREREPRILFDRMVAWFISNRISIPMSSAEFQSELLTRYIERDGMIFLSEQVSKYDHKRALSDAVAQRSFFVDDEASAIDWIRNEIKGKPKTYSEIHPLFLSELSSWKKNELELELATILEQNFLKYDGRDDVPSQIHTYLSTNFKDMRGLDKSDPKLVAKAKDRWYVPDPNKAADLEKVRLRALLKEFDTYKEAKKKIKQPRAEALRAGFNTAWEAQDFQTILDISAKIPPAVLQEDEKLLMFYDNALTLTSTEDDEW
ncbi:DNA methyltransferase [Vibrio harveyi]|uniref:DNA methyltransferase n=1 Tax=Vibrio harveyi TaxID=669 RepID=UPI00406386A9